MVQDVKSVRILKQTYAPKLIQIQVSLDENGKEMQRCEEFYPEDETYKIMQGNGLEAIDRGSNGLSRSTRILHQ